MGNDALLSNWRFATVNAAPQISHPRFDLTDHGITECYIRTEGNHMVFLRIQARNAARRVMNRFKRYAAMAFERFLQIFFRDKPRKQVERIEKIALARRVWPKDNDQIGQGNINTFQRFVVCNPESSNHVLPL